MRYKINIQNFAGEIQSPNEPTIKIKFRNTLNLSNVFDLNLTFVSNGETFSRIYVDEFHDNDMYYGSTKVYIVSDSRYTNANYQIIEISPNEANFQAFITAMKDNIEGVLLEKSTYKWLDSISVPDIVGETYTISFTCNGINYNSIETRAGLSAGGLWYDTIHVVSSGDDGKWSSWDNDAYKTITTTTDQYVNYDFYNYAITGGQLVKQETPEPTTGINNLRLGSITPIKYYLGDKELSKMYLGSKLVYQKNIIT